MLLHYIILLLSQHCNCRLEREASLHWAHSLDNSLCDVTVLMPDVQAVDSYGQLCIMQQSADTALMSPPISLASIHMYIIAQAMCHVMDGLQNKAAMPPLAISAIALTASSTSHSFLVLCRISLAISSWYKPLTACPMENKPSYFQLQCSTRRE